MPTIAQSSLVLERCPHCNVDQPNLARVVNPFATKSQAGSPFGWAVFACRRCGKAVMAGGPAPAENQPANTNPETIYPEPSEVDGAIPERAREYLRQAIGSISNPAGAVMLAASTVDAMLKAKEYRKGSLYDRIDQAAEDHLITEEMAAWAHDVRLDANDQRHADEDVPIADVAQAEKVVEFAKALGTFLFVLPARVERGRKKAAAKQP